MGDKAKLTAKIGAAAVAVVVPFIAYHEGTITHTYRDPIGLVTACSGHVDPALRMGTTYTKAQCEEMLYSDLLKHADDLDCVTAPLTDNQKAALLSFTFNVGRPKFCASSMVRMANAGAQPVEWCAELQKWVFAGGQKLPGLVNRRQAEYGLCVS